MISIKQYCNERLFKLSRIKLLPNEIHLWSINWKELEDYIHKYKNLISIQEEQRVYSFKFYEDRMRCMTGKILTKLLLAHYLEVDCLDIQICYEKNGKPYHMPIKDKRLIQFNVSHLFLGGTIAPNQLVAFMLMSLALSALLIAFEHSYNLLKDLNLAVHNLEQAYDTKPLSYKEEDVKLSHFDIAFEHVDFSYNKQADVLTDISFFAKENSVTALIGPSGSGKSTVANLIARFWDVSKGTIRIGGKDIKDLNPDGLLHYISEVFQENTLLSDTIYNNIKAGRENATEEEIIEAAKAARCHEFIEKLPEGYQTRLSEGGNTLSGGEKQRIAIARAILKNAPILLLDESTASLDADNEAKINQALDRLMKGKTVFVIAHRLNTIQNADQIILLNQGRIEEMGTHTELLAKKGHYYEMVQEQEKAKKWIVNGA